MNFPLIECSFLIPLYGDDDLSAGELHATDAWEWLTDELFSRFGGVTVAPGEWIGSYTDPETGQRVEDKSRKFVIALPQNELPQLRELLGEAAVRFHQKCVYLSMAGEVEFIANPQLDLSEE